MFIYLKIYVDKWGNDDDVFSIVGNGADLQDEYRSQLEAEKCCIQNGEYAVP